MGYALLGGRSLFLGRERKVVAISLMQWRMMPSCLMWCLWREIND
jgi:hypothetical protein